MAYKVDFRAVQTVDSKTSMLRAQPYSLGLNFVRPVEPFDTIQPCYVCCNFEEFYSFALPRPALQKLVSYRLHQYHGLL